MNLSDYPEIMKSADMCDYFRCSQPSLRRRWKRGELPKPLTLGREYIWPRWTIEEHLGKKPVEQPRPDISIDLIREQMREQMRQEIAQEITHALTQPVRSLVKGLPNHAPV